MYGVAEYGIGNLTGKCVAERARAMIFLAHPDFRENLEREAYEDGVIPKGFFFDVFHDVINRKQCDFAASHRPFNFDQALCIQAKQNSNVPMT